MIDSVNILFAMTEEELANVLANIELSDLNPGYLIEAFATKTVEEAAPAFLSEDPQKREVARGGLLFDFVVWSIGALSGAGAATTKLSKLAPDAPDVRGFPGSAPTSRALTGSGAPAGSGGPPPRPIVPQVSTAQPLHTLDVINPETPGGRGSWYPPSDVRRMSLARGERGHERGTVALLVTDRAILVGAEPTGALPRTVNEILPPGVLGLRNSTTRMDVSLLDLPVNATHPDRFLIMAAEDAGLDPWRIFISRAPCYDVGGGPCCQTFLTDRAIDWTVAPR
jgi:hypothetical protein